MLIAVIVLALATVLNFCLLMHSRKRAADHNDFIDSLMANLAENLSNIATKVEKVSSDTARQKIELSDLEHDIRSEMETIRSEIKKSQELTPEEKEALEAYAKAEQAFADGLQNILNYDYAKAMGKSPKDGE